MLPLDFHVLVKHDHFRDQRCAADHPRRLAALPRPRRTIIHTAAALLGRSVLRLGLVLLHYGRDESVVGVHLSSPAPQTIKLN